MARDKQEQNVWRRHIRIYRFLTRALNGPVRSMFNYTYDTYGADEIVGPVIVIPNHACAWDPILTGVAFRRKQMYFVATEHILRWKVLGPVINWLVQPVPRKKADGDRNGNDLSAPSQSRTVDSVICRRRADMDGYIRCGFSRYGQTREAKRSDAGHVQDRGSVSCPAKMGFGCKKRQSIRSHS